MFNGGLNECGVLPSAIFLTIVGSQRGMNVVFPKFMLVADATVTSILTNALSRRDTVRLSIISH